MVLRDLGADSMLNFYTKLFNILNTIEEDALKYVTKEDIEDMVSKIESIFASLNFEDSWKITEEFCLQFALKCFNSHIIQKRVNGIMYIHDAVINVRNKFSMSIHAKETKWMTKEYVVYVLS